MHNFPFNFVEYWGIAAIFQYLLSGMQMISRNIVKANVLKLYSLQKEEDEKHVLVWLV